MKIDYIIEELNNQFELNTSALDDLIKERGEKIKLIDWSKVRNVYSVSNHYNQVCEYKQLNLMIRQEAKVGSAVKGYAVNAILSYIESNKAQQMIQFHKDVRSATKSSIKRPVLKSKQTDEVIKLKQELTAKNEEIYELRKTLNQQKEEINQLKVVAKQLVINNIKLAQVSGIEVSVADLNA